MELKERVRKVDVNKMTLEQADALQVQLGQELSKIMDEANQKCNALLNIYGMQTQIQYKILKLEEKKAKPKKVKKAAKA